MALLLTTLQAKPWSASADVCAGSPRRSLESRLPAKPSSGGRPGSGRATSPRIRWATADEDRVLSSVREVTAQQPPERGNAFLDLPLVERGEIEPHEGLLGRLGEERGSRGEANPLAHGVLQQIHDWNRGGKFDPAHEPALDPSPSRAGWEVPSQGAVHGRVPLPVDASRVLPVGVDIPAFEVAEE